MAHHSLGCHSPHGRNLRVLLTMFQEFTHTDIIAQITIGGGSILAMIFLWRHCDSLSDGNVGGEPDYEPQRKH